MSKVKLPAAIDSEDPTEWGPAMLALRTDGQRAFVLEVMKMGTTDYPRAAAAAGFDPRRGYSLAHHPAIQEALREESQRRLGASLPMAASVLVQLAQDPMVAARDRAKIAASLLDRGGLGAKTEHTVKVEHKLDEKGLVEQITQLATEMGMDPKVFLGGRKVPRQMRPRKDDLVVEAVELDPLEEDDEDIEELLKL